MFNKNKKGSDVLSKRRTSILHTFVKAQDELDSLIADEITHADELQNSINLLLEEKRILEENTSTNKKILKKFEDFLNPED